MLKHRIEQFALVALLAGISAGCGASRPYKYYELDVAVPAAAQQATPYPITILVGRVSTPNLYRDNRIVYGSGPVQLGTHEYHRWAQMPADMLQQALVSALRGTGQYRSVTPIGSSARGDYVVRSELHSLYESDQPLAGRFSIEIELFDQKNGATVWSDSYSHDEPVEGKSVADVVEALNRNVRAGMQQLAGHLGQYFASHPPQQPAAQ